MPGSVIVSQILANPAAAISAAPKLRAAWAICAALALAVCVSFAVRNANGRRSTRAVTRSISLRMNGAMPCSPSNTKVMDSLLAVDYMGITRVGHAAIAR